MWNEQNVYVGLRGYGTMNLRGPVLQTRLWPPQEMLQHHLLEKSILDTLRELHRFEISPHYHVFTTWKAFIFCIILCFFLSIVPEILQPNS
jgi:hypothetical protein